MCTEKNHVGGVTISVFVYSVVDRGNSPGRAVA